MLRKRKAEYFFSVFSYLSFVARRYKKSLMSCGNNGKVMWGTIICHYQENGGKGTVTQYDYDKQRKPLTGLGIEWVMHTQYNKFSLIKFADATLTKSVPEVNPEETLKTEGTTTVNPAAMAPAKAAVGEAPAEGDAKSPVGEAPAVAPTKAAVEEAVLKGAVLEEAAVVNQGLNLLASAIEQQSENEPGQSVDDMFCEAAEVKEIVYQAEVDQPKKRANYNLTV